MPPIRLPVTSGSDHCRGLCPHRSCACRRHGLSPHWSPRHCVMLAPISLLSIVHLVYSMWYLCSTRAPITLPNDIQRNNTSAATGTRSTRERQTYQTQSHVNPSAERWSTHHEFCVNIALSGNILTIGEHLLLTHSQALLWWSRIYIGRINHLQSSSERSRKR